MLYSKDPRRSINGPSIDSLFRYRHVVGERLTRISLNSKSCRPRVQKKAKICLLDTRLGLNHGALFDGDDCPRHITGSLKVDLQDRDVVLELI